MTDTSSKALYSSILRMKEACAALELELTALREQLSRAIARCAPRDVKAIAYDPNRFSSQPTMEQAQIERIAHLTFQIGERERDLAIQKAAYELSVHSVRLMAKKLEQSDLTSTIFMKAWIEGKSIEAIRMELGVSAQTVSYHKTLIYNSLDIY